MYIFYFVLKKKKNTFTETWRAEGNPDLKVGKDDEFRFSHVKLRGFFTSARMTRIKKKKNKSDNNKRWLRMWRNKNSHTQLVGM